MQLTFFDAKGRVMNLECDPNDKISTLLENLKAKFLSLHPEEKEKINSISISFDGEVYTEENNEEILLKDLNLEDDCRIGFSTFYNGGLI